MRRTMFIQQTAENRYHVTADDMPLGSEVEVSDRGYRYTPYFSWSRLRGRLWFVRVREEGEFLEDGRMQGLIRVSWHGIPVASNRLVLRRP